MSQDTKTTVLEVIEHAAARLNITSKSKLYLKIVEAIESEVEEAKPAVRVHSAPPESLCVACEG